jgi:AcrR family transcriptional regulator
VARPVDLDRRTALLDEVVTYLGEHGLANVSLRPMAKRLNISVNSLMHHFGSKDDLIITALRRSAIVQEDVERRWLASRVCHRRTC